MATKDTKPVEEAVDNSAMEAAKAIMEQQKAIASDIQAVQTGMGVDLKTAAAIIAEAVSQALAAKDGPPKKKIGQYLRGDHSAFNHKKVQIRPNFHYFQNGSPLLGWNQHSEEIELLNRITHSGKYCNDLVTVLFERAGHETNVFVRYSNKTREQQNDLKDVARNFTEMLRIIVDAQEEEDAEESERAAERLTSQARRHFGGGRNSREAREAAGE